MRSPKLIILLLTISFGAFAQNPRWKEFGTPIPACPKLDVRWELPSNEIPAEIWLFRLLPNKFSPQVISNLMAACSFTEKDISRRDQDAITLESPDHLRKLDISFSSASIHYDAPHPHYGPTNLAQGVPLMSELPKLATDFLRNMDINLSEIINPFYGGRGMQGTPQFDLWEPYTAYFVGDSPVTNVAFRAIGFWRCVEGIRAVGGDGGHIHLGEHEKMRKLSITWHRLERYKAFAALTRDAFTQSIHQGKAAQGPVPKSQGDIDWTTAKTLIVRRAVPAYLATDSGWLYPDLALETTIETGRGNIGVEVDCPIIDESKLVLPVSSP